MKRTELKRMSALKQGTKRMSRGRRRRSDRDASSAFWWAARNQRVCAVTRTGGPWQAHHVIERQWLRQRGLDEWDPRNALRVLTPVHTRHTDAVKRIPLRCLTDENLDYAFELMGLAAHLYLHRHYSGEDPRVVRLVAQFGAPDAAG